MSLSAGACLGPYELVSPLGAGGMGEVWKARDTRLGRDVALKVVHPRFATDAEQLRRFELEARAASRLDHPNILVVHDVGSHEGSPYLVSELLEGESLRDKLNGPLPLKRAVEYAVQAAHGLSAAHDKGIVHRDLKPENLFVTSDGRIKILDFGLAKLAQPPVPSVSVTEAQTAAPATDAGVVMGTVGYMSPEQVRGQSVDSRSDLFAFGAVLYEMLTGKRAFSGNSAADVMSAILTKEPPDLPTELSAASPALDRIVRHCLEKSVAERFQSARDIAFNLESLAPLSTSSAPVSALPEPRRSARAIVAIVALLAVLAVFAGGLLLGRRQSTNSPPSYHDATYKPGFLTSARFARDGHTILYSAALGGDPLRGFLKRLESPDSVPFGPPGSAVLAVSPSGEVALALDCKIDNFACGGTLATIPLAGGAPRELYEHIQQADWSPDGSALAVVHQIEDLSRLEFPPGKVLYETRGYVSDPRFSPRGDAIAFFDHALPGNNLGSLALVDLSGKKRVLTAAMEMAAGLAWSPSGNEIWFSANAGDNMIAIHAVTLSGKRRVIARAPEPLRLHDVLRDGRALVSDDTWEQRVFALAPGETRERDLTWLSLSIPGALSRDGKTLLFTEQDPVEQACLRRTEGSPVVRLGEGVSYALSPDGKWALVRQYPKIGQTTPIVPFVLIPTGAGERRDLVYEGIEEYRCCADFLPDGKEIVFAGRRGKEFRFYRGSLEGGKPRPATPPAGPGPLAISSDGRRLLAKSNGVPAVFSLDAVTEVPPRPIPGATVADVPVVWSDDGRSVYLRNSAKVFRVDVETGRRILWKEIIPADPSGAKIGRILMTPDGRSYAYGVRRERSRLFVVEGLK